MQKARDSTKPIILASASAQTSMNTGRREKAVNRKNVHMTETSKASSCGQELTCQVCLAMLPSGLKNGEVRQGSWRYISTQVFIQRRALQCMSQPLEELYAGTRVKYKNCTGNKSRGGAVMWGASLAKPLESVTKGRIRESFCRQELDRRCRSLKRRH